MIADAVSAIERADWTRDPGDLLAHMEAWTAGSTAPVRALIDQDVFWPDPSAVDVPFSEVSVPGELGGLPAWVVEGEGEAATTWVLWVHGWGATREGGRMNDELLYVRLLGRAAPACKRIYDDYDDTRELCVGSDRKGEDSCQGDSGGPIVAGEGDMGGTMRLGLWETALLKGSVAARAYGEEPATERHRHRYEVNNAYRPALEAAGLVFSGTSPDGTLVEIAELPREVHPFFVGTQAHPEFRSRPTRAHPLFRSFIAAAVEQAEGRMLPLTA